MGIGGPKTLSMCELGGFLVGQMELCGNFKYQSIQYHYQSHLLIEIKYLKLEKNLL